MLTQLLYAVNTCRPLTCCNLTHAFALEEGVGTMCALHPGLRGAGRFSNFVKGHADCVSWAGVGDHTINQADH